MRTLNHQPSLCPNLLLPSDYCHEWTDNNRKDLSLPPFHSICCVYFPCILNLSPLKALTMFAICLQGTRSCNVTINAG